VSKTLFLSYIILIICVFSVFGIAIATIMQCFVADEEMYPQGSYFVPNELESFLKQIEAKQ